MGARHVAMAVRSLLLRTSLSLSLLLWLAMLGCNGPRPTVTEVKLVPAASSDLQRVEATVANGGGEGQARLKIRLRDTRTGHIVESDKKVDLQAHDRLRVIVDIPAPPADYVPDVTAEYPPR